MQTVFWQRKSFLKYKNQRRGAEINTTVVSSSHGRWFLSRSRGGEKTLAYTEQHFVFSYHPCTPNPLINLEVSESRQSGLFRSERKLKLCFMGRLKCAVGLSHTQTEDHA